MNSKSNFSNLRKGFLHSRAYILIFIGIGIIFLTFLTADNALEIVISGIASVFIGSGVNNLSVLETHQQDKQKIKSRVGHSLKVLEMAAIKIENMQTDLSAGNYQHVENACTELKQFTNLMKELLIEDE
jgi:hypothetical protein